METKNRRAPPSLRGNNVSGLPQTWQSPSPQESAPPPSRPRFVVGEANQTIRRSDGDTGALARPLPLLPPFPRAPLLSFCTLLPLSSHGLDVPGREHSGAASADALASSSWALLSKRPSRSSALSLVLLD